MSISALRSKPVVTPEPARSTTAATLTHPTLDASRPAPGSESPLAPGRTSMPLPTDKASFEAYEAAQRERLKKLAQPFPTDLDLGNRGAFSMHNALELGKLSKQAYQEFNVAAGNIQFLYQENRDHQILAFAGSYDNKDWVQDAKFLKTSRPGMGRVHSGFSEAFDSIEKDLKILDKSKPVVITGHSLGGAVATLTALHLKQKGYDVHSVYTYGSPRVGNSEFKDAYGKAGIPTFRTVNGLDLVPRIPRIGFEHVGTPLYLSRAGQRLDRQESAWTLWPWQVPGERVSCHEMNNYLATMRKHIS